MNTCMDCGTEITRQAKRCNACLGRKTAPTMTIHRCKSEDCNNPVDYRTYKYGKGYCKKCTLKGIGHKEDCQCCICKTKRKEYTEENNPNYKNGITLQKHYCNEEGCNNEISYNTACFRGGKCISCSKINNQLAKGYHHTKETKEILRQHSSGKNNTNWKGGISDNPYPKIFNKELKEQIRNRDNYTCQNCGMTEEEHLIVIGNILSVHHIDYNKENCKKNNLITTCLQCNVRANYNRKQWKKFYQEKMIKILNLTK